MKTIQDLKEHLIKNKDAVVLLGPGVIKNIAAIPSKEEQKEFLTNKCLRRTPEEFWKFFFEKFYINHNTKMSKSQEAVCSLYTAELIDKVITLYPDGLISNNKMIDVINLHGDMQVFSCQKPGCKIKYPAEYVLNEDKNITTCEACGGKLKPEILMFGETYDDDRYQAMISLLNNTHTLITIGLDYTETPIVELIAAYCDLKSAQADQGEVKVLVSIVDKDLDMDLNNQIGFHEFIVKDDCDAAMVRLLQAIE